MLWEYTILFYYLIVIHLQLNAVGDFVFVISFTKKIRYKLKNYTF